MSINLCTSALDDKYRRYLHGESEEKTLWRHGGPPNYDMVNKLFEQGRTKEWATGSLEEVVQNAIKTWEMELSHKLRLQDFKSINQDNFSLSVNGRKAMTAEETLEKGSYNALLETSLPPKYQYYDATVETFESSHNLFRKAFPRGFAWEVLAVYSGPPTITFKYRHWGFMEGAYKTHEPTGEMVEFTGIGVLKVDESLRADDVEIYYDPGELFGGLMKAPPSNEDKVVDVANNTIKSCPFFFKEG